MLSFGVRGSKNNIRYYLLLGLAGVLLLLLIPAIRARPAPAIHSEFGGATIDISASSAWSILPGDCLTVRWNVEGIQSIYIDGQGKIGWGDMEYCPSFKQSSPQYNITAKDGTLRNFALDIYYLPNQVVACLLLVAIASFFLLACYYLVTLKLDEPPPLKLYMLLVLAIAVLGCLLGVASGVISIPRILSKVGVVFANPSWQYFGLALAGIVFIPLLLGSIRQGLKYRRAQEFVAIAGFFVFLLLLYLPFGFDVGGNAEEWIFQAYFEGRPSEASGELGSRVWILVPHALANIIGVEMFAAYHIVNFLMFWGKLILLYGILRRLRVTPFISFLCTMLFIAYPVNPLLMSLRSIQHTFSLLSLLAALYLALETSEEASRSRLAGVCLGTLFSVGAYEAGYAVILAIPLVWLLHSKAKTWRNFNVTAIWYLFPVVKIVYLLLLSVSNQGIYGEHWVGGTPANIPFTAGWFGHYADILVTVYRRTFFDGWNEALNFLGDSSWIAQSLAGVAVTGIVAVHLAHRSRVCPMPTKRQTGLALLAGLLFVLPSVGVLMWLEQFNRGLWRMYIFVPVGAAAVAVSLIILITKHIKNVQLRKYVIICICSILMFPALLRLFAQHEHIVKIADIKANVLMQVVEQVPAIDSDALMILLTDMGLRELGDNYLYPFRRGPFDSAIHLLYQERRPLLAVLCWGDGKCNPYDSELTDYDISDVVTDVSKLVLLRLHEDLTVELLYEVPVELGIENSDHYDVTRLVDSEAPLPARAVTMLAFARRGSSDQ